MFALLTFLYGIEYMNYIQVHTYVCSCVFCHTLEPVYEDHPKDQKNMIFVGRGSFIRRCFSVAESTFQMV